MQQGSADRGTVSKVVVDRNVLRRGTFEDVKKVWECTELGNGWWKVGNEFVWREGIVKEPGGGLGHDRKVDDVINE